MSWFRNLFKSREQIERNQLENRAALAGFLYARNVPGSYGNSINYAVTQYWGTQDTVERARIGGFAIGQMDADKKCSIYKMIGYPPVNSYARSPEWLAYQERYYAAQAAFNRGIESSIRADGVVKGFFHACDLLQDTENPQGPDNLRCHLTYRNAYDHAHNGRLANLRVPPEYHLPQPQPQPQIDYQYPYRQRQPTVAFPPLYGPYGQPSGQARGPEQARGRGLC